MALNSSGQISLGGSTTGQSIALELGLSATAQISLNDTAVRTLLGKASGQISLSDAWGKSNAPAVVRPTSYTGVVGNISNLGFAYDTDLNSNALLWSADTAVNSVQIDYLFSQAGSFTNKTLYVKFQCTQNGEAPGAIQIKYSVDNGSNWSYLYNVSGTYDSGLQTLSVLISSATYANVRVECFSTNFGDAYQNGIAGGNSFYIYDIRIS